jgi:hypothetical protein
VASETDIVNLAASHVAQAANAASLDTPTTVLERLSAQFYPIARDQLLESHPWYFAKKRTPGTPVSQLVDEAWSFAYSLPNECLRVLKIVPPAAPRDFPGEDYVLETSLAGDSVIYTNVDQAVVHFIWRATVTGRYSPLFVTTLSYLLGSYLAGPILKGKTGIQVSRALLQLAVTFYGQACAANLSQSKQSDQYANHTPKWMSDR